MRFEFGGYGICLTLLGCGVGPLAYLHGDSPFRRDRRYFHWTRHRKRRSGTPAPPDAVPSVRAGFQVPPSKGTGPTSTTSVALFLAPARPQKEKTKAGRRGVRRDFLVHNTLLLSPTPYPVFVLGSKYPRVRGPVPQALRQWPCSLHRRGPRRRKRKQDAGAFGVTFWYTTPLAYSSSVSSPLKYRSLSGGRPNWPLTASISVSRTNPSSGLPNPRSHSPYTKLKPRRDLHSSNDDDQPGCAGESLSSVLGE